MAFLTGLPTISELDLYTSTTQVPSGLSLGALVAGPNGKYFQFVRAGGSALVVGNVLQAPAQDTQFDDMAVPAAVAAGTVAGAAVVITNGTTAVSAGDFIGGTAEVSVTPGLGEEYTIIDHSTASNGAALTLYLDRPIRTAWTTSTKVTLRKSTFRGVIQAPATTLTGSIVGGAVYAIPASEYGFVQVRGVAALLSDASSITATNQQVCGGSGTAGCVTLQVAGLPAVGLAMRAAASGKTIPVDMKL